MSRYNGRNKANNNSSMYQQVCEDRGVKNIVQYTTTSLKFPTEEDFKRIQTIDHVWDQGDMFWRLASKHYGDPRLWWVIAHFNRKPTEGHIESGELIKIPVDLAVVLGAIT